MTNYGEKLYEMLPAIYKDEDAKIRPHPYPLKRFMKIAGTGFEHLEDKLQGHYNLYDLDRTPSELLPYLAEMMGFDFPYEMTEVEQRSFLKVLPLLYKFKGTAQVFDYLGQVIFGASTRVESTYRMNVDPELAYKHVIDVYVQVAGSTSDIAVRADRYNKFAENFRPLNTELNPVVQLFYSDIYEILRNGDWDVTKATSKDTEAYDKNRIAESAEKLALLLRDTESYNKVDLADSDSMVAVEKPIFEVYSKPFNDGATDNINYIGAKLNLARLNGTMILNEAERTITRNYT